MFGISTFAQTTYAGLGTNSYILSVSENITMVDANSIVTAFTDAFAENVKIGRAHV